MIVSCRRSPSGCAVTEDEIFGLWSLVFKGLWSLVFGLWPKTEWCLDSGDGFTRLPR